MVAKVYGFSCELVQLNTTNMTFNMNVHISHHPLSSNNVVEESGSPNQ